MRDIDDACGKLGALVPLTGADLERDRKRRWQAECEAADPAFEPESSSEDEPAQSFSIFGGLFEQAKPRSKKNRKKKAISSAPAGFKYKKVVVLVMCFYALFVWLLTFPHSP
jgi:hypothetical protein